MILVTAFIKQPHQYRNHQPYSSIPAYSPYHVLWQEFLAYAAIYTNRCAVCEPIGYDALACSLMGCRSTLRSRSFLIPISHTKHMQCISHYALGVWPRYIFRKRCSVARAPASRRSIYPPHDAQLISPASYTNAVPLYLFKRRAAAIKRCSLRLIEIIGCRSGT